jgi:hypothetical protein
MLILLPYFVIKPVLTIIEIATAFFCVLRIFIYRLRKFVFFDKNLRYIVTHSCFKQCCIVKSSFTFYRLNSIWISGVVFLEIILSTLMVHSYILRLIISIAMFRLEFLNPVFCLVSCCSIFINAGVITITKRFIKLFKNLFEIYLFVLHCHSLNFFNITLWKVYTLYKITKPYFALAKTF